MPEHAIRKRFVATSRNGRHAGFFQADGLHLVDLLGPSPRRRIAGTTGESIACIAGDVWWLDGEGALLRAPLADPAEPARMELAEPLGSIIAASDDASALVEGGGRTWLVDAATLAALEIDGDVGARVLAVSGRRIVEANGSRVALRTIGRRDAVALRSSGGIALAAAFVLGGRAVAVWVRHAGEDAVEVFTVGGQTIHRIASAPLASWVVAADANLALGTTTDSLVAFDLRYGRVRATSDMSGVIDLDTDRLARQIVTASRADGELAIMRWSFDEVFQGRPAAVETDEPPAEPVAMPEPAAEPVRDPDPIPADALPHALAPALPLLAVEPTTAEPYADANAHLEALLDVVAARTALAIAESWHSGRRSFDGEDDLPCQREVLGLLGEDVGLAADALRHARARLRSCATELRERTQASLAAGVALPFHELAGEYELSAIATQILACAAAPRLRTRVARLYGVLAGLDGRTACADHLLEVLVEAPDVPRALARELAPDAPLVRGGLVHLVPHADRIDVTVDAVLVDRLRGLHERTEISDATARRTCDRLLHDVIAPADVKRTLLVGLAERDPAHPARIVIRGRRGSGRHTLVAALAHQVGRGVAAIDATRLPRGAGLPAALTLELTRGQLAACVPVVSGLDTIARDDAELRHRLQAVLRRHPGPLALRAAPDADLPIDSERIEVELPPLSLAERAAAWRTALSAHGAHDLTADELALLAARFRFGPGTIEQVAGAVARRGGGPIASLVDELARHHIAGRLERVATRVSRVADWDQVTLVDDMRDSILELIGRVRHQRTVFEDWGFDRRITTSRGLTALFYGPPGTGKTMVAGLIGRELGLAVWRIDLARVMSKWVGETEKSLADVFDAAEDGQVLLLFDEADSLFGKRSEVKTSNDRYANLAVNYLLQRLDSFEGVAILTTNLEGSIDPAFRRRLSMRLYFPFPDEELRAQLWAAHVPPGVPCAGALDFTELARRYPLSGGYIRNSALRAAFLAAQEKRPLCQDHLVRAVQLEYRELGKLSSSGRVE
jgi:ATPase family associated with various cellular activities (AAA)/Winged helix domain, variant